MVDQVWDAGYADARDPRYLLSWIATVDAIPSEHGPEGIYMYNVEYIF